MRTVNLKEMPTAASTLFSAYASLSASMMLLRSMANELIPTPLRSYLYSTLRSFFTPLSSDFTLIIDEFSGIARNQVYDAAHHYLRTKINPSTKRLHVSRTHRQKTLALAIETGEEIHDHFQGIRLKWRFLCIDNSNNNTHHFFPEKRSFELTFHRRYRDSVLDSYLPYVLHRADQIRDQEKVLKIYSLNCPRDPDDGGRKIPGGGGSWGSVVLDHPATFDTLALDPELKKAIIDDLDRFVRRREFYRRVGKAWKRGYLLYGPPGTGKSSLVAAMANYLRFDIFDLELTSVHSNSNLRSVLLSTTNKSILVIEDIDCSAEIKDRQGQGGVRDTHQYRRSPPSELTLSGLLNFIDGLWSSCGDERIIVFTTNHKDKLDPALLRPGRMDVHINMSYCCGQGFKLLASNYLGLHDTCQNPLYQQVQGLIHNAKVSPAEVAEELMKNDDADVALEGLAGFLKRKTTETNQVKQKDEEVDEDEIQQAKKLKISSNDDNISVQEILQGRQ